MAHRYMYRVHIVTHLPRLHLCCNYCCVYRRHTRTKWRTRDFSAERSGGDRSPVHHRNTYACPSSLLITGPSLRAPQAYLGSTYIRWMHTCHGELMLELGPQKPCTYVVPVTPRPPPPHPLCHGHGTGYISIMLDGKGQGHPPVCLRLARARDAASADARWAPIPCHLCHQLDMYLSSPRRHPNNTDPVMGPESQPVQLLPRERDAENSGHSGLEAQVTLHPWAAYGLPADRYG